MGWKCPNCRRHVYKSGKCPHCSNDLCEVCGARRSPSKIDGHHISYELDIVIQACRQCHEKIHYPDAREPGDNHAEFDRLNPLATDGGSR